MVAFHVNPGKVIPERLHPGFYCG